MDKLLLFPGRSERGIFTYVIDAERIYLEKTAAEYHPTIASYINAARPLPGKTQILLTALGSLEWWGDNVNADAFPEEALAHEGDDYGYKTFERYAKVYKHHVNKDPAASYGDVPLSVYNPVFHRVELIVAVDNARAPDIVDRMERGDYPDWSMGCRVPYDICSICHNKAPTRKQYCEHARYLLGKIDPVTNKKVFVINTKPRFFDISLVLIGADRIAKTHRKVASASVAFTGVSSALIAEKMAASEKGATIDKEIPATPPASVEAVRRLVQSIPEVKARERSLPTEALNRLGSFPLPQTMSTLAMLGILPKPAEFQRIVLVSLGRGDAADQLDRENACFDPMDAGDGPPGLEQAMGLGAQNFSPVIWQILAPYLAERSYAAPHLGRRLVVMVKRAEERLPRLIKLGDDGSSATRNSERKPVGILPMLGLAAAMYGMFAKNAPKEAVQGLDKLVSQHPGLATALGLGLLAAFTGGMRAQGAARFKGNMRPGEQFQDPDVNDVFARIEEQKSKPYMKVASKNDNIGAAARRLIIGIPAAYMASGILQKHRERSPNEDESRVKAFIRKNPDVVSGLAIADAMLALRGKGTHSVLRKLGCSFESARCAAEEVVGPTPFLKTASAGGFLLGEVGSIFTIGEASLPGRVIGGLFDQAALEQSGAYVSGGTNSF